MKNDLCRLISICFPAIFLLLGCEDKDLEFADRSSQFDELPSFAWSFDDSSEYSFDSNYVEIASGKASLKLIDQTHSGTDFSGGTHVGTAVSGSNITLLTQPTTTSTHVNTVLPSRASNLVGYWRLDGSAIDETGVNNGSLQSGATVDGEPKIGSASGNFDGSNYILVNDSPSLDLTTEITMCAWIKRNRTATREIFFGKGDGVGPDTPYWLEVLASDELRVLMGDGTVNRAITSDATLTSTDRWYHVCGTYNGTQMKLYLDGSLDKSTTVSFTISSTNYNLGIGRLGDLALLEFDGLVDEAVIYNVGLSEDEIFSLYQSQNANFSELSEDWTPQWNNIVGYWKMDGNWQDSSGNDNHGSINGDPSFNPDSKIGSTAGDFDGTDDFVSIPDSPELRFSGDFSIAFWVKKTAEVGDWSRLVGKGSVNRNYGIWEESGASKGLLFQIYGSWNADLYTIKELEIGVWYHVVAVRDSTHLRMYIDGIEDSSLAYTGVPDMGAEPVTIGGEESLHIVSQSVLDDVSIWNSALSSFDIATLYSRQKQKYVGRFESPVIDLGDVGSWTNLNAITSLPFGKEIVAQSSESSSDYSDLSGDLSDGLIAFWNFNETSSNTAPDVGSGITDYEDQSSSSNHLNETGGVSFASPGVLSNGVSFDGVDDELVSSNALGTITELTVCGWVKYLANSGLAGWIDVNANSGFFLRRSGTALRVSGGGDFSALFGTAGDFPNGVWKHNCLTITSSGANSTFVAYLDGASIGSTTENLVDLDDNVVIGRTQVSSRSEVVVDEVGIWSRALTSTEILQLYRRGANRIKYQVRSCAQSDCSDGVWSGPGGSGVTAFSELFNRDSIDMSFTCNTNTTDSDNDICVNDEIALSGDSSASSPSFSFSDFPTSAQPANNRYFQYRVMMEAEDNSACSGEPCLPELTSVEVGPTGRYFAGSPSVVNQTSYTLDSAIDSIEVESSSGCNLSYQISNDGSNFYYWDGSSWVSGTDVSESNDLVTLNSQLGSFTDQIGLGDFYFKTYLGNSNFGQCEIDQLEVTKSRSN